MNIVDRFLGGRSFQAISVGILQVTGATIPGGSKSAVNAGLTASTTQTLAGGLPLTAGVNVLSTVANSGDAVTLAIGAVVGQSQKIFNDGAHPAGVFPVSASVQIDGGSAGAKVTLTNALRCEYTCTAVNVIKSSQLGAVSA